MLARKMALDLEGMEVGTTPMLVPSFSSRANIDVRKTIEGTNGLIRGPILVSAYDVKYVKPRFPALKFPSLIFLDSGGYECAKDEEFSSTGLYKPQSCEWNRDIHRETVSNWPRHPPTIVVSYDHPLERERIENQIKSANSLFRRMNGILRELLIKPQSKKSVRVDVKAVMNNINKLCRFDVIGFTEKELGSSVLERMTAIAKIRLATEEIHMQVPIHIFGSLDPVTTPLYYMSGADIFDGLSWVRFIFNSGDAYYMDSYGPRIEGIHMTQRQILTTALTKNHNYLLKLEKNLAKFQSTNNFQILGPYADFFEESYDDLEDKLGRVI